MVPYQTAAPRQREWRSGFFPCDWIERTAADVPSLHLRSFLSKDQSSSSDIVLDSAGTFAERSREDCLTSHFELHDVAALNDYVTEAAAVVAAAAVVVVTVLRLNLHH